MKKRQYKVRFENGKIIPLEPIDLNEVKEGMIIFLDEETDILQDKVTKGSKAFLSEPSLKKIWDNSEDDIYNDL